MVYLIMVCPSYTITMRRTSTSSANVVVFRVYAISLQIAADCERTVGSLCAPATFRIATLLRIDRTHVAAAHQLFAEHPSASPTVESLPAAVAAAVDTSSTSIAELSRYQPSRVVAIALAMPRVAGKPSVAAERCSAERRRHVWYSAHGR